jgi:hypothetical protein
MELSRAPPFLSTGEREQKTKDRGQKSYRRFAPLVAHLDCFVASLPRMMGLGVFQVAPRF